MTVPDSEKEIGSSMTCYQNSETQNSSCYESGQVRAETVYRPVWIKSNLQKIVFIDSLQMRGVKRKDRRFIIGW